MVSTSVVTRVKAAVLAFSLAFASVLYVPAVASAAPNTNNPGKRLGQLKDVETAPPTSTDENVAPETQKSEVKEVPVATLATPTTSASTVASSNSNKQSDPAGNNGTVKIDRVPFDSHPNNEPHVTCSFQVDFYGFDEGVGNAEVNFELHPPTKDGRTLTVVTGDLTPNIGEDAAGGGTDVDAQETYTLKFTGAPHEQQGYHVKLTVHAPGSQGADTKHKVFWVQPCNDEDGHVLAEETPATAEGGKGSVLPESMPSTGASTLLATVTGLIAAGLTYVLAYRYDLRRLFN